VTRLTLLDWRRRVFALYAEVRRLAAEDSPEAAHRHWRTTRDDLFARHPDSPIPPADRPGFAGLTYASYDAALRFEVGIDHDVEPERLEVETARDGVIPMERVGRVDLPGVGGLDVWWFAIYGGGTFVPLRDATAGTTTYGGGRYVLDTIKGADLGGDGSTLVVDLNFAYNPSCAYDPQWVCPLAPPGNVVDVAVEAGELIEPA
jgi:uncharacterized protein (DUF1684 family)